MNRHVVLPALSALLAALLTGACATAPTPRYYTLSPLAAASPSPAGATDAPSLAIAPITLPAAVDRAEMVVRTAPNRVDVLDNHRWAESLRQEIARTVADDLARRLPGTRVAAYPQYAARDARYTVLLDIQRFESEPGQAATLDVQWSLRREADGRSRSGRTSVREATAGTDIDALAAAHSRALARLADDLAQAVRGDSAQP
ncbi:MAG: PqiC family protein [Herbaspirillum sp.]